MNILHIVFPVLIGAIIGYCTNYIAIRMLFHPYNPVKIGKWRLPFTPGIIPKNQSRVANAVGTAVSEQLLSKELITDSFRKDGSGKRMLDEVVSSICDSEKSVSELISSEDTYEEVLESLGDFLTRPILEKANQIDFTSLIADIGREAMEPLVNRPVIAMFLTENMQNAIYERLGQTAQEYLNEHGEEALRKYVMEYLRELGEKPLQDIIESADDPERIRQLLASAIEQIAVHYGDSLLDHVDIKEITKRRIEEMKMDEVEALVLSVMKQELQAVINLGALIGALIGIFNIFI